MQYTQHNPLPLPRSGAFESVTATMDTVFDWQYELRKQNLLLIQDLIGRVMADESRHVAFGVLSLNDLYTHEMSGGELREREEFVIEATHLLRDRLIMTPVFERLGWDTKRWTEWSQQTPFMRGFRQMMFSKIVPNLRRLGLLTPRVRAAYAKLDLLQFEHHKDSVEEPEITPPEELVQLLTQILQQPPAAPSAA